MRRIRNYCFLLAVTALVAGCAGSSTSLMTGDSESFRPQDFRSLLVIGVAHDYDARARFERKLASELSKRGTSAVPYYRAVGGNKPISRETVRQLVQENGFDAVLITRVLNRDVERKTTGGSAATKTVRKDEGGFHLFRYDYHELNEPATLRYDISVKVSSEVFDTESGERVWAIESDLAKNDVSSLIVDEAISIILKRLQKDDLIS